MGASASKRQMASLTDDLLEEIFLRIGSPTDLARASTACVTFRFIIADPSFLRRYRSLHPPLLLGFLGFTSPTSVDFRPAEAPHPNAAAARAVASAADFSFDDYVPRGRGAGDRWCVCDIRDGHFLLSCSVENASFLDLAVCDPLSLRYQLLPPISDDLLASAQVQKKNIQLFRAFHLPPSGDELDDTSFRVVARVSCEVRVAVFIFSSGTGRWSASASVRWDALSVPTGLPVEGQYVYGCFYWKFHLMPMFLKFNMSSLEFSIVDLPPGLNWCDAIVVEAGEGRLGTFSIINNNTSLCYYIWQTEGESSGQFKMENTIPLPVDGYRYSIFGASEGFVFILGRPGIDLFDNVCFSLEIKTMKIERICQNIHPCIRPYFGFPPSMSQRRV